MSRTERKEKAAAIRDLLRTEGPAVARNTRGFNAGRHAATKSLENYEALKKRARKIKEQAIEHLPRLIDRLTTAVETNGGTVHLAADETEANRKIRDLVGSGRRVVKSKSMTSEEIRINEYLEARDIEVIETDLGEWVLQIADEAPSHIVAPALHKSRKEIARLFNETFHPDPPLETAQELTRFARKRLGALIKEADVGMTGANFLVAETGTIALVTSEGNARKSVVVPPTYIAVAGVEKIIPTVTDLQPFIELLGRSGTGQEMTSYVSLFTPPFETTIPDFARGSFSEANRSFHLILIDNGRLAMREDPQLVETLYCIRCSACANSCANFQSVGGHAFGGETYSGGIATGWETGVHGLESAKSFNDLCTGCSRCVPACPVKIDIPWINTVVRDRINRDRGGSYDWLPKGLLPDTEAAGIDLQKRVFGNFEKLARLASTFAPVSNWFTDLPPVRAALELAAGIDRRRSLPQFRRQTFLRWFDRRSGSGSGQTGSVVLYVDPYTNYVHVDRGKAAVRALEALGVEVHVSPVLESGRAPLSQGMISTAERSAQRLWDEIAPHLDAGREVLAIEPSDLAMWKREYEKLLAPAAVDTLQEYSFEVVDYLEHLLRSGASGEELLRGNGARVAFHSHCQQRTLSLETPTVDLLQRRGFDVLTSNVECCGMAGSFGYKVEYYDLSMDVGLQLKQQFSTSEASGRILAASGTSCTEQLEALFHRPVVHPVELIAPSPKDRPVGAPHTPRS
jgi:iron-sulfur cluster protein